MSTGNRVQVSLSWAKPTVEQHQKRFNLAKAKQKKGLECC